MAPPENMRLFAHRIQADFASVLSFSTVLFSFCYENRLSGVENKDLKVRTWPRSIFMHGGAPKAHEVSYETVGANLRPQIAPTKHLMR